MPPLPERAIFMLFCCLPDIIISGKAPVSGGRSNNIREESGRDLFLRRNLENGYPGGGYSLSITPNNIRGSSMERCNTYESRPFRRCAREIPESNDAWKKKPRGQFLPERHQAGDGLKEQFLQNTERRRKTRGMRFRRAENLYGAHASQSADRAATEKE